MSFIHVPFCSRYYFMDEKRCISVPRTRSQIGAINTQQVDTDGEYFYSLLRENECFAEMCRKCFISPQLWWGHVARGTCQCLHIPPITAESVAADTGKYYSWRDYLESVLSILRWTLQQHCVSTLSQSFGCRATLTEYSTKNILTLKNIWLPMLLRARWRSGTEDARVPPEVLRSYRHRHHRYRPPTPG